MRRPNILILFLLLALAPFAGCGDLLKQPFPAKSYFAIMASAPPTSQPIAATNPSANDLLLIHPVRVTPPFDGLPLVYRLASTRYSTDYYNNWIATPSAMMTGALSDWLDRSGPYHTIYTGSAARAKYTLESEVTELLIDRSDKTHLRAVITARFFLLDESRTEAVLLDTPISKSVDVASDTPENDAVAIGKAYGQVLEELSKALAAQRGSKTD